MVLSEEGHEFQEWTKQDYLDLLKKDRFAGITELSQLLHDVTYWDFERELEDGEEGISDETHMIQEYFQSMDDITRSQYVLKTNEDAALFKLGFTVEEVKQLIGSGDE